MYCIKCGKDIGVSQYCDECGIDQMNPDAVPIEKKSSPSWKVFIGISIAAGILVVFFIISIIAVTAGLLPEDNWFTKTVGTAIGFIVVLAFMIWVMTVWLRRWSPLLAIGSTLWFALRRIADFRMGRDFDFSHLDTIDTVIIFIFTISFIYTILILLGVIKLKEIND